MGGSPLSIITSVFGLMTGLQQQEGPSDNSAQLEAERQAREEEQRKREADERKRNRDKVLEARALEKKRMNAESGRKTTLGRGSEGLADQPGDAKPALKTKLGE